MIPIHSPDQPYPVLPAFPSPLRSAIAALSVVCVVLQPTLASAEMALLGGSTARPLRGQFNSVPVLHSNQPEEVRGPGILIDTRPGWAYASETGEPLANATYSFNGPFGLHLHHKYAAPAAEQFVAPRRRRQLHLAAVLINSGRRPVRIRFETGAVRNSFEAPYLGDHLMGVKPLGPRPWNTGPGDATAVQMLRGRLDPRLSESIEIPAESRVVLFSTALPALGFANALLRGQSDGPFAMAVVAAPSPGDEASVLATLDAGRLAPGRTYLGIIDRIHSRDVFARVAGVALGDRYSARISHDLDQAGPLHVPLTSTVRTHFGSGDVQVNPLVSRMVDSALDNVGTYGVRFDIDLNLRGSGSHALVLSHPSDSRGRPYTAFRGSIEITTPQGRQDVHVGMRAGESLSLASLQLQPGEPQTVQLSLVYPADATPGHLLSVLSETQLARFRDQERNLALQRQAPPPPPPPPPVEAPPPLPLSIRTTPRSATPPRTSSTRSTTQRSAPSRGTATRPGRPSTTPQPLRPPRGLVAAPAPLRLSPSGRAPQASRAGELVLPQPLRPERLRSDPYGAGDATLADRYRQAVEAQERLMRRWSSD